MPPPSHNITMGVFRLKQLSGFAGNKHCIIFGNTTTNQVNNTTYGINIYGELYGEQTTAETILQGYTTRGVEFIKQLDGAFIITITDGECLHIFRDLAGLKRLFYLPDEIFIFATSIADLCKFPNMKPELDNEGLAELFAIGPAITPGFGLLKGVQELPAGGYIKVNYAQNNRIHAEIYHNVTINPHEHSYGETIENVRYLLTSAIKKRMKGDICSMLSGGLDSSIISAVSQKELGAKPLPTYSFDFADSALHFTSNTYQPERDAPWALKTAAYLGTQHNIIECKVSDFAGLLYAAVDARGFPGMADVDSSLLYFMGRIGESHTTALSGECADEIFGGYPWFRDDNPLTAFPWSKDIEARKILLSDEFLNTVDLKIHAQRRFEEALADVPKNFHETQKTHYQMAYLNLKHFMAVLCERLDAMSLAGGVTARVPFADTPLIEYMFNVPWAYKYRNNITKGLLRDTFKGLLPDDILFRKKSPFPKNYNPKYEKILAEMTNDTITPNSPIASIVDIKKIRKFIEAPQNLGRPWFGQLMAGPQLLAYLLQINYWLKRFSIKLP